MKKAKRKVDLVVISDVHLGTYGCHAEELLWYLKSIEPGRIILNGDIVDIWQFSKRYWPKSHMKVIKYLISQIGKGVEITYVTGNHDEMLRKFAGFELGSFSIVNKVKTTLPTGDAWIFHGDVFDITMQHSKWLAKLGGVGYDTLILINRFINHLSEKTGRGKISLSKKIKNSVKGAVKFINSFEQLVADLASENGYKYVVCGHIHQPEIRTIQGEKGPVLYLNSGDWVENLTALEYHNGEWSMYKYEPALFTDQDMESENELELTTEMIFNNLVTEFNMVTA
jgi:UDP-2,3-diacylglucosamine pyrophosphatase LpxH